MRLILTSNTNMTLNDRFRTIEEEQRQRRGSNAEPTSPTSRLTQTQATRSPNAAYLPGGSMRSTLPVEQRLSIYDRLSGTPRRGTDRSLARGSRSQTALGRVLSGRVGDHRQQQRRNIASRLGGGSGTAVTLGRGRGGSGRSMAVRGRGGRGRGNDQTSKAKLDAQLDEYMTKEDL